MQELKFHRVCGDAIALTSDMRTAGRHPASGSGIIFSSDPLLPEDVIHFRFSEFISHLDQHRLVHIGFTSTDPATLRGSSLNRATYLTSSLPGFRTCRIPREFNEKIASSAPFSIQRCKSGAVVIRSDELVALDRGGARHTRSPLWLVIELWGRPSAVELIGKESCKTSPVFHAEQFIPVCLHPSIERPLKNKISYERKCIECCSKPPDSFFSPCGHKCLCYDCARNVKDGKCGSKGLCPLCKEPVQLVSRLLTSQKRKKCVRFNL